MIRVKQHWIFPSVAGKDRTRLTGETLSKYHRGELQLKRATN